MPNAFLPLRLSGVSKENFNWLSVNWSFNHPMVIIGGDYRLNKQQLKIFLWFCYWLGGAGYNYCTTCQYKYSLIDWAMLSCLGEASDANHQEKLPVMLKDCSKPTQQRNVTLFVLLPDNVITASPWRTCRASNDTCRTQWVFWGIWPLKIY